MALEDRVIDSGVIARSSDEPRAQRSDPIDHRLATEYQLALERRAREQRARARRRRRMRVRRNRTIAGVIATVLAAGVWAVVTSDRPSPRPSHGAKSSVLIAHFRPARRSSFTVPGRLRTLPWKGQGAVAVVGAGVMSASPGQVSAPIASLTKMMTAYVILHDHPLGRGDEGPSFTMGARDVAAWVQASSSGLSNLPVAAGEVLSEHQLLEALLLPSADNIADYLAVWDAGSVARFVAKMNATAAALGLSETHYADASGVNPMSRSDAVDQARLAAIVMSDPVVRGIVSHRALPFQVAGTIRNVNPALGVDGIVGVKSGYTAHAHGCLVTAAYEKVHGRSVLLIAVTLGQRDGLWGAATVDEHLTVAAAKQLVAFSPARTGTSLGDVAVGGSPAVPVVLSGPTPVVIGWPGLRYRESLSLSPGVASGAVAVTRASTLGRVIWSTSAGVLEEAPITSALTTSSN